MDDLLGIFASILRWRVGVAVACTTLLAIGAVRWIPWVGGLQALALAFAGFVAGLAWEDWAETSPEVKTRPDRTTSKSVAVLAFGFGGGVWGALSSTTLGSAMLGGLLLAGCLLLGSRLAVVRQQASAPGYAAACFASALATYVVTVCWVGVQG
jgi:hypothetical protein